MFYWRHTNDSRTERIPIGTYDSSAPPRSLRPSNRGYSISAALDQARNLAKSDQETPGGIRAGRLRERAAQESEAKAAEARSKYTLEALCTTYVGWLKSQGKWSSSEARVLLNNHLTIAHPELAGKAAVDVERKELVGAVRRLIEKGQLSTARKLRSYMRAAYACALHADSDATLPSEFAKFGIVSNPVEGIVPVKTQADKNPLPAADLRKYWWALRNEPGVIGAALRLHLLTGGQRPSQLARLTRSDLSSTSLRLLDPKGRRAEPRVHQLPVSSPIRNELTQLAAHGYLLSTDGGKTPMAPSSLTNWAREAAESAGIDHFQLKRVRSGIETLLAEKGVPLHVRGQLQSHGIGGVQERHYDAHEYLAEKRHALTVLYKFLEQPKAVKSRKNKLA